MARRDARFLPVCLDTLNNPNETDDGQAYDVLESMKTYVDRGNPEVQKPKYTMMLCEYIRLLRRYTAGVLRLYQEGNSQIDTILAHGKILEKLDWAQMKDMLTLFPPSRRKRLHQVPKWIWTVTIDEMILSLLRGAKMIKDREMNPDRSVEGVALYSTRRFICCADFVEYTRAIAAYDTIWFAKFCSMNVRDIVSTPTTDIVMLRESVPGFVPKIPSFVYSHQFGYKTNMEFPPWEIIGAPDSEHPTWMMWDPVKITVMRMKVELNEAWMGWGIKLDPSFREYTDEAEESMAVWEKTVPTDG